ncbi:MAG: hypothetical protein OEY77_00115 [Nitrospira sp.]|nr:hypothetical protein [Nitrospira sp.]
MKQTRKRNKQAYLGIRLQPAAYAHIAQVSKELMVSKSEVVRRLILAWIGLSR